MLLALAEGAHPAAVSSSQDEETAKFYHTHVVFIS